MNHSCAAQVPAVSFSRSYRGLLATGSVDGTVALWDAAAGAPTPVASKALAVGQIYALARAGKFPTSKAPLSAVFHSFRLLFGRAIISRNGLEAWMLFPARARAEHSR